MYAFQMNIIIGKDYLFLTLQLRSYLNEIMLDQLPILADMQRYLEQLSMMDPPPVKKDLVLEQVCCFIKP